MQTAVIGFVIRQVSKPCYRLFIVYFTFAIYQCISLGFTYHYRLLYFVRLLYTYCLYIELRLGNIASDYVELLLLSLEIVRRVRVHKHGSIDK